MSTNKEPFLYAVSVAKENYSYKLFQEGKDFTINFLSEESLEDILTVGRHHGDQMDKWKLFKRLKPTKALKVNALMIEEALLIYECFQEKLKEKALSLP